MRLTSFLFGVEKSPLGLGVHLLLSCSFSFGFFSYTAIGSIAMKTHTPICVRTLSLDDDQFAALGKGLGKGRALGCS